MVNYGIDWEGPVPYEASTMETVEVPATPVPCGMSLLELENNVDPLACSDEYGIDLYLKATDLVSAVANDHS